MKKLTMFFATMAFAIPAPLAVPAPALAANPNVDFCKGYVGSDPTLDPNLNMGECISLLTTGDNYFNKGAGGKGYAVHVCDYLLENYPDDFYASYASKKECVDDIRSTL